AGGASHTSELRADRAGADCWTTGGCIRRRTLAGGSAVSSVRGPVHGNGLRHGGPTGGAPTDVHRRTAPRAVSRVPTGTATRSALFAGAGVSARCSAGGLETTPAW